MKKWQKTLLLGAAEIAGVLILYQFLLGYMARHDIVSSLFASGRHVPIGVMLLTLLFVLARLFVELLLPGIILGRLGLALWDARTIRRRPTPSVTANPP